jgi:hypothetical protein
VGENFYSDTRHHFAEFESDPEILEERKLTLRQIAPREQDSKRWRLANDGNLPASPGAVMNHST